MEQLPNSPCLPTNRCVRLVRISLVWGTLLACAVPISLVRAEDPLRSQVVLWTTDGERLSGSWTGMDRDQLSLRTGDRDRQIPTSQVWQLVIPATPQRPQRPTFWLSLTNGDRWGVPSVRLVDEELEFQWGPLGETQKLAIAAVAGIQPLSSGTSWRTDESEWLKVIRRHEKADRVALRNGDHRSGEISRIDKSGLQLTSPLGVQDLTWSAVIGLAMNPELADVPKSPSESWSVLLSNDSGITATHVVPSADASSWTLTTTYGVDLTVSVANIRSLTHWSPDIVPLSRTPIAEQTHRPLLGEELKVSIDRNVRGLPLRSDPSLTSDSSRADEFPALSSWGIGLSSGMTVQWNLDGQYRRFQSGLGLDATACAEGHAIVTLQLDDKPPTKIALHAGQPIVWETALDLTGVRLLTLETDFGEHADACDWINLYSPILVR